MEQATVASGSRLLTTVSQSVHERVVGQNEAVEGLLVALLTGGHILLEGLPGLAKTLMVRTLAQALHTGFRRIQFTPDLLPTDIVGTPVFDQATGQFRVQKGPIFSNIILADEINRAPPKVQAALLEAMEERQVTIAGETYQLDSPFMVLATQNPVELHGTYPLAEAQLDRFALKLEIGYPSREEEKMIVHRVARTDPAPISAVATAEEIITAREEVSAVHLEDNLLDYIVELTFATREPAAFGLEDLEDLIEFGTSPRATIFLTRTARARAYLKGRDYVMPDDIKAMAPSVLRHRLRTTYEADARGVGSEEIIRLILNTVPSP
ncbi:MAG: MoxR family ATPase [Gemmatimonadota bacterium]|nr:MoxR family ATPase [Gemmatimonadota bacterium]|tara:strand:+ start:13174 stop:14145 length:972 start_codon:yes stop_codon:yes gene_type:complete